MEIMHKFVGGPADGASLPFESSEAPTTIFVRRHPDGS